MREFIIVNVNTKFLLILAALCLKLGFGIWLYYHAYNKGWKAAIDVAGAWVQENCSQQPKNEEPYPNSL